VTEEKPADEEPVEAELVEQGPVEAPGPPSGPAEGQPPPGPAKPRPPYRAYRPAKKGSGFGRMVIILVLVLVAAVVWRKELTDAYDRLIDRFFGGAEEVEESGSDDVIVEFPPEPEPQPPKPEPKPEKPVPDQTLPTFKERTIPELPAEPLPEIPMKERTPGLAYSIIDRKDISFLQVTQYEMYVVVPADYRKDDLLRMALDVVAWERKQGVRHAIKFYCFKDKVKTEPKDAFAEVVWAPEGNFLRAREAVRAGSDNNEYRIIMKE